MKENQRQQINRQIEEKNRQLGQVKQKDAKIFGLGAESIKPVPVVNDDDIQEPEVFTWRKRWFVEQKPIPHYSPNDTDFITYAANGNEIFVTYKQTISGALKDTNIPQYTIAVYDIEVYKSVAARLVIPISCSKSIMVQVNDSVIYDSGDESPNSGTSITIDIPEKIWTKIEIFYYTHSSRVEENNLLVNTYWSQNVEKTRIPVPEAPVSITATQGTVPYAVSLSWDVRDSNQYEYYQIYYGTNSGSANSILAPSIPGTITPLSYNHGGISTSGHYFYKVRGITSDGEVTNFSSEAEGWAEIPDFSQVSLSISLPNNPITNLAGYYNQSWITGSIFSTDATLGVPPTLIASSNNIQHTGRYLSTDGLGTYNYIVSSFVFGGQADVRLTASYTGSDFTIDSVTGGYIYDTTCPIFNFTISADTYHQDDTLETWTRNREVFIFTTSGYDPVISNIRNAGLYQVKLAETIGELSSANWIDWQSNVPLQLTLSAGTGLKTIYGIGRDRAGNATGAAFAWSDSIYYATGNIENITVGLIRTGYSFLDVHWAPLSRGDVQGYELWRTVSSRNPDNEIPSTPPVLVNTFYTPSASSYRDFWDGFDDDGNKIFPFKLGELARGITYWYWVKAFTHDGRTSSGWSSSGVGMLDSRSPNDDTAVTTTIDGFLPTGVFNGEIRVRFRSSSVYPNTTFNEGLASYHDIYRLDLSAYPGEANSPTNAVFVKTISKSEEDSNGRFFVYDAPPYGDHFYQYFSYGRSFWGYVQTGVTYNPIGTGIRINDGPPSVPLWDTGQVIARSWGVRLALQDPSETDIMSYDIYIQSGTWTSDPPSTLDVAYTFPFDSNYSTDPPRFPRIPTETLPLPTGRNTFWAQARDKDGLLSNFSSPLATSISVAAPPKPAFIESECFSWFGYNRLTWSGGTYTEGLMQGYKLYRGTGSSFSMSSQIGTVLDNSNDALIPLYYDDSNLDFYKPYYYWVTAFNVYDIEGQESNSIYLYSGALPEPEIQFPNFLDNSSFERDLESPTVNWTGTIGTTKAFKGVKGATVDNTKPLFYSGYIFVQQNKPYYLSFFRWFEFTSLTRSLSGEIIWYSASRESVIGTSSFSFSNTDSGFVASSWQRLGFGPFQAPAGATNATLKFSSSNTNDWYIDAVQWENYVAGQSPKPYMDTRTLSQERLQANIVNTDMLQARSVVAEKIAFGEISGGHIQVGSIELDKLVTIPGSNKATPQFGFDLITSGVHTIYVSGGTLNIGANSYNITGVHTDLAISHVGRLFGPAPDNGLPYYAYYNNTTKSGELIFATDLATILSNSENKLVWKFTNTTVALDDNEVYENAGYFYFNGDYFGPGVQINANQITAGAIRGQFIAGKTITTDKLIIGNVGNRVDNSSFELSTLSIVGGSPTTTGIGSTDVGSWSFHRGYSGDPSTQGIFDVTSHIYTIGDKLFGTTKTAKFGLNVLRIYPRSPGPGVNSLNARGAKILIETGVHYSLSTYYLINTTADTLPGGSFFLIGLRCYDANKDLVDQNGLIRDVDGTIWTTDWDTDSTNGIGVQYKHRVFASAGNRDQWLRTGYDFTITGSTVKYVEPVIETWQTTDNINVPIFYFDGVMMHDSDSFWNRQEYSADGGVLIQGGHIDALSIDTEHLRADSVSALNIQANSVTADKISANSITTEKLQIKSQNYIKNNNFERWKTGQSQYLRSGGGGNVGSDDVLDGFVCRITNVGNVEVAYRRDTNTYKFGSSSLQISGTTITGVNTYIDSKKDPESNRYYLNLEQNVTYTLGAWIYKDSNSPSFEFNTNIFVYDNDDNIVHSYSKFDTIDSTYNSNWKLLTQTFSITGSMANRNARLTIVTQRTTYSPYLKYNIGALSLVHGNATTFPSGYIGEGTSTFGAGYIKTGRIDIDQGITVGSALSQVEINTGGIRVGPTVGERSELSRTNIKFYDASNNVYNYSRRTDYISNITVNTYYEFDNPFSTTPTILLTPGSLLTYSPGWSTRNQFLTMFASDISESGFLPSAYISSGGGGQVNTLTLPSNLDNNNGFAILGTGFNFMSSGNSVLNFTSRNISYNNNPQSYPAVSVTIGGFFKVTGYTGPVGTPTLGIVQVAIGIPSGASNQHILLTKTPYRANFYVSDPSTLPFNVYFSATFGGLSTANSYGFHVRFLDYPTGGRTTQYIWGSGLVSWAEYSSFPGDYMTATGTLNAIVIDSN